MGARKRLVAEARKETRKTLYIAKLNKFRMSPRKVRLVVDLIRGLDVEKAIAVLDHTTKKSALPLKNLVLSAISNYRVKSGNEPQEGELFIQTIYANQGETQKRLRYAPQGRGYRMRKRSSHITLILGTKNLVNN